MDELGPDEYVTTYIAGEDIPVNSLVYIDFNDGTARRSRPNATTATPPKIQGHFDSDACLRVDRGRTTITNFYPVDDALRKFARELAPRGGWLEDDVTEISNSDDPIYRTLGGRLIYHDRDDLTHPYTD